MPKVEASGPGPGLVSGGLVTVARSSSITSPTSAGQPIRVAANGMATPEVAGSDFLVLDKPKPQTVGIVFARDGDGKTHLVANYCPEPVVIIGLDGRGEREIKKALNRGRKIFYLDASLPANVSQMSHEQARKSGQEALDLITRNYEWAIAKSINEWGKGTFAFDTSTELRDIVKIAVRGRADRPQEKGEGDFGKSDSIINRTLKYFCDRSRNSNLNLILLSRSKPIYEGREDTGRITWDTDKIFSQAVDWAVEYRMVGGTLGGVQLLGTSSAVSLGPSYEIQATKPKLDHGEMGKVYRQSEWGEDGPFAYMCTRLVPGSQPGDWK
jgi:hypothetical protein